MTRVHAPGEITVRDASAADVDRIAPLVARQPLLVRYGVGTDALMRNLLGAIDRHEDLLVAETRPPESTAVPVGMAWFLRDGTFAHGGYLRLIALAPGSEGRGVGGLLLDEVERRTRERSRFLFLLVSRHNDGARRFYTRRGYAEVGTLDAVLKPDIDEVILWKRL